jgi:hypothetical protein
MVYIDLHRYIYIPQQSNSTDQNGRSWILHTGSKYL